MAPRKKQAPQQQPAVEQPAHSITSLHDISDDLLGKVYKSCEDAATKRALRTSCAPCYRSPAINSCLNGFTADLGQPPEQAVAALAAFPPYAQLETLTVVFNKWRGGKLKGDLKRFLPLLLGPLGVTARTKLQQAERLRLGTNFDGILSLDPLSAAALALLFPVLNEPVERGEVVLGGCCSVDSDSLGVLSQWQVHSLQLCGGHQLQHQHLLPNFGSLRSLLLSGMDRPLSLEPLAGASSPNLTKLVLAQVSELTGLDACFAHHPIQELELRHVSFPYSSTASQRPLSSSTLKRFFIRSINLSFPSLSANDFPALQALQVQGLNLADLLPDDADESEWICAARRLALGLATFPSLLLSMEDNGYFRVSGACYDVWWGHVPEDGPFVELLEALEPLQPAFGVVERLCIDDSQIDNASLRLLASLFPNITFLCLTEDTGCSDLDFTIAVHHFPALMYFKACLLEPPCDLMAALAKARKSFTLRLSTFKVECFHLLEFAKLQWDRMREHMPDQFEASLEVRLVR